MGVGGWMRGCMGVRGSGERVFWGCVGWVVFVLGFFFFFFFIFLSGDVHTYCWCLDILVFSHFIHSSVLSYRSWLFISHEALRNFSIFLPPPFSAAFVGYCVTFYFSSRGKEFAEADSKLCSSLNSLRGWFCTLFPLLDV